MLEAGMKIAQGPNINVLILLSGKAPMLEIVGGIDLNHFKQTGKARELEKDSPELVDILMFPEKYIFSEPSITDAINCIKEKPGFESLGNDPRKEKMLAKGIDYYKSMLPIYGLDIAKVRTRLYLRKTFDLKMNQANSIFSMICKALNKPEV